MAGVKTLQAAIEAILFTMGESVELSKIAKAIEQDEQTTEELLQDLMKKYESKNRGIRIIELDKSYQMCTKKEMYDYLIRVAKQPKKYTLTDVLLETMSIIAYKQPITRVEIEEIRGVGADMMLRKLLARDLIKESGRSDAPGRPILYEVTPEFMDSFKLYSLDELPELPKFGEDEDQESEDLFKQ